MCHGGGPKMTWPLVSLTEMGQSVGDWFNGRGSEEEDEFGL